MDTSSKSKMEKDVLPKTKPYSWIVDKTAEIYRPERIRWFIIYCILLAVVFSGIFFSRDENSEENNMLNTLIKLNETFILFFPVLYVSSVLFFIFLAIKETFGRDEKVKECFKILWRECRDLGAVGKFEKRAAAEVGAARVFLLLPGLIVAFVAPELYTSFANLDFFDENSIERGIFSALLICLIMPFFGLYFTLERASLSFVIHSACIELIAEVESQLSLDDSEEVNGHSEHKGASPHKAPLVSMVVVIGWLSWKFLKGTQKKF